MQAPARSRIGAATQATEKSDSLIWIDSCSASAAAAAADSTAALVSARSVGDHRADRRKSATRSLADRCPTRSRPCAVQLSGTRVPIREVTRKWPGHSDIASTTTWSRSQICTVFATSRLRACISSVATSKAVTVQPRAEPGGAVRPAARQTLLDEILNQRVGRRKRRSDRLGDCVGTRRRARLLELVEDQKGVLDAADAGPARSGAHLNGAGGCGGIGHVVFTTGQWNARIVKATVIAPPLPEQRNRRPLP